MTCGFRTKRICRQWRLGNIPLARSNGEALVLENPMNISPRLELLHIHKHKNVDIDSVARLNGRRLALCL